MKSRLNIIIDIGALTTDISAIENNQSIKCIDAIKQNILIFDLMERRSKELIEALKKAHEGFAH